MYLLSNWLGDTRAEKCHHKPINILVFLFSVFVTAYGHSSIVKSHVRSTADLEYGTVLYEYYQQDYFNALIENAYAETINNAIAKSGTGKVLKGGMMVSYGMADESYKVFQRLLNSNAPEMIRNGAWYYLAKLYFNKSDRKQAYNSLKRVKGKLPERLHMDYYYLATLVKSNDLNLRKGVSNLGNLSNDNTVYPYILFNLAVGQLQDGKVKTAVQNFEKVAKFSGPNKDVAMLADRAKHGLAQIGMKNGDLQYAWDHLSGISTTGLYSNRALLSYAWVAIKLKQYTDAVPALEILNERSIALAEVQEGKVLLAHIYEQEGSPRKALKSNIVAEKEFKNGLKMVSDARKVIRKRDVPREFILNLENIIDDSDWYGSQPSVDYKKLTPFLIDLMASHVFHETLKELRDLYAIENNLKYWSSQAQEHVLILENAKKKSFNQKLKKAISQSRGLSQKFSDQTAELRLHTLSLEEKDQKRLTALLESTGGQLNALSDKVKQLSRVKSPYKQPQNYTQMVKDRHKQIQQKLVTTRSYINQLEPVMRRLVNAELNKHEERMRYYWAQSRLAKARLYDTTLMSLDKAKEDVNKGEKPVKGSQKGGSK